MQKVFHSYEQIHERLNQFFEEDLNDGLKLFRSELTEDLRKELSELRTELFKIKKDDPNRYELILKRLNYLVRVISNKIPQKVTQKWTKWVIEKTEELPEQFFVKQTEDRFIGQEEDSFLLKAKKSIKKTVFSLSKLIKGKDYRWEQRIPFRAVIQYSLLADSNTYRDSVTFEYSRIAKALMVLLQEIKEEIQEELNEETNNDISEEQKNDASVNPYRINIISEIETYITEALKLISDFQDASYKENPTLIESHANIVENLFKAGTIEFPNKKLRPKKLNSQIESSAKQTEKALTRWEDYLDSQIADFRIQLEMGDFGAELEDGENKLLEETHNFFRDICYIPTENGIRILKEIISHLEEQKSEKKSLREIESMRNKLQTEFMEQSLYIMQNEDAQRDLTSGIQRILSDIELSLNNFSEELLLAETRSFNLPIPEVTTDDFKWRKIASRFIKSEAISLIRPEQQNFEAFIKEQLTDIEEAAQIVDVNLQAAVTTEDYEGEETPLEIAVSGLKRAIIALEKSIKDIREKQNEYEFLIKEKLKDSFQRLAVLMLQRRYDEFELRDKALIAKETALGWKERLIRWYASFEDKLEVLWRYSKGKFRELYHPIAYFLGFKSQKETSVKARQDLTEFLITNKSVTNKLPFIYQRLFRRAFVIDKRFYIDGNDNITHLEKGYQQWVNKVPWTMAVVGQKGSGKSILLHFFKEHETIKDDVVHINIERTTYRPKELLKTISKSLGFAETDNVDELIQKIERSKKQRVVIFEGLQNCYLRNVNGFEAIRQFWVLLSQTSTKLFWVVTCSSNAWYFFIKMFDADQFFSQVLRTDSLSNRDIQDGIMLRHKATGYDLVFEPSAETTKTRAYRKLLGNEEEIQEYLEKEYFNKLSEVSKGNFSIAMIFWVNSIKEVTDSAIVFNPIEVADIDMLEIPSRDILFALASLIRHDTLTIEEMALSTHQPVSESKLILGRLASKGLIIKTSNGYTINHLVYRQIVQLLNSRNILH